MKTKLTPKSRSKAKKKIILNKCYGGYSLSPKALVRLAELQGKKCYFFKQDISAGLDSDYIPTETPESEFMFTAFSVPNPNDYIKRNKDWHGMSDIEKGDYNKVYDDLSIDTRPDRTDPLVIQVVEELGDLANGKYAELEIVEIPADAEYEISDYDGVETLYFGKGLKTL